MVMAGADAPRPDGEPRDRPLVLLVEDEVLIRMMLGDELRDAGFHVIEAANAAEALSVFNAGARVELLLTDVRMPGAMDGVRRALAARDVLPELRVVVMSSEVPDRLRLTPFEFVAKPFETRALLARIRALLGLSADPEIIPLREQFLSAAEEVRHSQDPGVASDAEP